MFSRKTALALLFAAASAKAQSCSAAVDGLIGFGVGTTGGSSSPITVTSCSALEDALGDPGNVIHIDGKLSGCGVLRVPSDTTIQGVGSGSGLVGGGFRVYKENNVILRNLDLSLAADGGDLIDIETATYVWVDHCDLYNEGIVGGKDDYDGLLDIKRASDFITVSWTKFHDHWKGTLVGHSASNSGQDSGTLRVTYSHNSFINVNSRLPSLRFGTGHILSNCYQDNPTSGINSREGAQVLVEGNYFENTRRAIVTDLDANDEGFAVERDNIFVNSDTEITQVGDLEVSYSYDVTPADSICACVEANGGTGVI